MSIGAGSNEAAVGGAVLIRLYGPVEITVRDDVRRVKGALERAVLAFLSTRPNRVVSSDVLVDELWPETDPAAARRSLRVRISNLRKLLHGSGCAIEAVPGGYRLVIDPEEIDLTRYDSVVRSATSAEPEERLTLLATAAELRRGEPLVEFRYDDFAAPVIAADLALTASADLARAEALIELGRSSEAIVDLTGAVESDPADEAGARTLMRALSASGRIADALDVYGRLAAALAERGLDPSDETRRAEEAVLLGSGQNRHESGLPSLPAMVGRDVELATVVGLVRRHRFVTILGPGGIGKTLLAVAVARALDTSATIEFVDLAALDDPERAIEAVGAASGALHESGAWRGPELLADSPGVVIVDNCEHLLPEIGQTVEAIARVLPATRIIATSRTPLGVATEQRYVLGPLDTPAEGATAEQARACSAVSLFLRRSAAIGAPTPDPEGVEAVGDLVRALDGVPLAIELAAMKTTVLSPRQILDRIDERLEILADRSTTRPTHQRSLDAAIAWSVGLLSPTARATFPALSVFRGGFDIEAAEAVLGATSADVIAGLAELVDHSLLVTEHGSRPRYRMLETVRLAASASLAPEEGRAARHRFVDHYRTVAATVQRSQHGEEMFRALQDVDPEGTNLAAAISASLPDRPEVGAAILADGWRWWHVRGRWTEGGLLADEILRTAVPSDRDARLHFLDRATRLKLFADRTGLRKLLDDQDATAVSLGRKPDNAVRALLLRETGALEEAAALHREMAADELERGVSARATFANLAVIHILRRDSAAAREAADRAIEEARRHGETALDTSEVTLAEIDLVDGLDDAASARAASWLAEATAGGGDAGFAAMCRHIIAAAAVRSGSHAEAAEQLRELFAINVRLGEEYFGFVLCIAAAHAMAVGRLRESAVFAAAARRLTNPATLRPYLDDLLREAEAATKAAGATNGGDGGDIDLRALLRLGVSVFT